MEKELEQTQNGIIKVVLFGPESSGKSTLAKALAKEFNTGWVPEFMRMYLQEKWDQHQEICTEADMIPIAKGQIRLENEAAKKANKILFCDTNLLQNWVYANVYFQNYTNPLLEKYVEKHEYQLYILCDIDVPWEADDLRDKPNEREKMFAIFASELTKRNLPYLKTSGNVEERLAQCKPVLQNLLKNKSMFQLSEKDHQQIQKLGISQDQVERYLQIFKEGIPFSEVKSAANINEGIEAFSDQELNNFVKKYEAESQLKVVKFTPASGAATRMFKAMHQLMAQANSVEEFSKLLQKEKFAGLQIMANQLDQLPFYDAIEKGIENFENLNPTEQAYQAFQLMLNENGLGLDVLPKGLIPFHQYHKTTASAFEEHFYEAAAYASKQGKAHLHFTISEEHLTKFETEFNSIKNRISKETQVEFDVSFSFQKKATDTLAVDMQNQPFRLANGKLLFRPGGHGALIENLNDIDADVIFIKNIDNISHRNNLESNAFYKKALAGYLLEIQEQTFEFIKALKDNPSPQTLKKAADFLKNALNVDQDLHDAQKMIHHLNKPIRVCGMVKNEGEPGGGPYWMVNGKGNTSLQIVEKSQINLNNPEQASMLNDATHFNPVDLVCGVKNYHGEKFNLLDYVNPDRGFITEKSVDGKALKALELPGLWNGAMEYWNTLFVEVPSSTFCPVKSVKDLLKPLHVSGQQL